MTCFIKEILSWSSWKYSLSRKLSASQCLCVNVLMRLCYTSVSLNERLCLMPGHNNKAFNFPNDPAEWNHDCWHYESIQNWHLLCPLFYKFRPSGNGRLFEKQPPSQNSQNYLPSSLDHIINPDHLEVTTLGLLTEVWRKEKLIVF